MSLDNISMRYTMDDPDNITIFRCSDRWTVADLQKYEIFEDLDYEDLLYIVDLLTDPPCVANGSSLEIMKGVTKTRFLNNNYGTRFVRIPSNDIDIFKCSLNWTIKDLQKYEIFEGLDYRSLNFIVMSLTAPINVAHRLNIKITREIK